MSKKNKKQEAKPQAKPAAVKAADTDGGFFDQVSDRKALLFTGITFLIYYIFSYFHTSFYQGEEAAHFMNMKAIWHNPVAILGNWPKTGWKLVYALPALAGKQGVLIMNCLIASFSGFFAYKTSRLLGLRSSLMSFFILFSQPLWFFLAPKNYSEILCGFTLILTVYLFVSKKYFFSSLILSFALTIRQELYPFAMGLGLFLLFKKQWLGAIALAICPLAYDFAGWMATGDKLYILTSTFQTSSEYSKLYPRQGFDHFFLTSIIFWGAMTITLLITYFTLVVTKKIKLNHYIVFLSFSYFLAHCVFNWQSVKIGPAGAGNLRYMMAISPLVAVLGNIAFDYVMQAKQRMFLLFSLVPLFIIVATLMSFQHNWIKFNTDLKDPVPGLLTALFILILIVPATMKARYWSLVGFVLLQALIIYHPKPLEGNENATQRDVALWAKENGIEKKGMILQNMAAFTYFFGKNEWEFEHGAMQMNDSILRKAPVGTQVFWDSHFATKYGKVQIDFFNQNLDKFKKGKEWISEENDIQVVYFEKIKQF